MSCIVTFYSYKGGVGRTSAMANIAVLLAKQDKNVLLMDWDLEAPGLDRFFRQYTKSEYGTTRGLIHMLFSAVENPTVDWKAYISEIQIDGCCPISMISSGDGMPDYVDRMRSFSWSDFFERHQGGLILDRWRDEWKSHYDFVFIDSRTGITDIGGVCTVFLPDILVLVFTANEQSFEGGIQVAAGIQKSRRHLAVPRPPLAILPLPGRFDARDEVDIANVWLDRFSRSLKPFYDDWLPKQFEPRRILELTKIPYITKFSFGEPLPVLEQSLLDPEFPGFYFSNVARLIASDFSDSLQILSPGGDILQKTIAEIRRKITEFPQNEELIMTELRGGEAILGERAELCELYNEAGTTAYRQRRTDLAEYLFRRALLMATRTAGPAHPLVMSVTNNLASVLRSKGELGEAEDLYREILQRLRSREGSQDSALSTAYSNLAEVLYEKGNLSEAEDLYREALYVLHDTVRYDDPSLIGTIGALAGLLQDRGNLQEAEDLYRDVLSRLRRSTRPPPESMVDKAYLNLASVLRDRGNFGEAEALLRESLSRTREGSRRDSPTVNSTYNMLANLLREMGNLPEAETMYRQELSRRREFSRPNDPALLRAYSNLGSLLRQKGELREAEDIYREALSRLRETSRPSDTALLTAYSNLADLLTEMGNLSEAESLYREILSRSSLTKLRSISLTRARRGFARLLVKKGEFVEAEALYRKSLEAFSQTSRRNTFLFADTLVGLAETLIHEGKLEEARSLLTAELSTLERSGEPADRAVAIIRNKLATLE